MAELFEQKYTYKDILTLIKCIYGIVKAACCIHKDNDPQGRNSNNVRLILIFHTK